jgi:hypothetical protein
MAASPAPVHRVAHEAKILWRVSGVKSVPRMEATSLDADFRNGSDAAQGILFGLLLCAPFWVGVYAILF